MTSKRYIALAAALFATPALAEGDIAAGEAAFNQCQTCHIVADGDGNVLAGRNSKTGPNLYAISGRQAGIYDGFRYGKSLVEAGENGLIWDEETFVAYVQDPNTFLREFTGDRRARGNMAFRVRSEDDARNLYAFIASLSPAVDGETEEEGEAATTN